MRTLAVGIALVHVAAIAIGTVLILGRTTIPDVAQHVSKVSAELMENISFPNGMALKDENSGGSSITSRDQAPQPHAAPVEKVAKESMVNLRDPLEKRCHQPRPKALFCFSLVRTPPEPTAALLANQLSVACDGWALFGDTEDPSNNVTKAFTKEDMQEGWEHGMREVITNGVWKRLLKEGALEKYEWFVMVETDTFVRASTLRKVFTELHTSCVCGVSTCTQVYSTSNEYIDGYFIALQADLVLGIKSLGWPGFCDIVLTGHEGNQAECLKRFDISHIGPLRDPQGSSLIAIDQDTPESAAPGSRGGPEECEKIAHALLKHASKKIQGPLCACTAVNDERPSCVSEYFVAVHHVKSARTYSELIEIFP